MGRLHRIHSEEAVAFVQLKDDSDLDLDEGVKMKKKVRLILNIF